MTAAEYDAKARAYRVALGALTVARDKLAGMHVVGADEYDARADALGVVSDMRWAVHRAMEACNESARAMREAEQT